MQGLRTSCGRFRAHINHRAPITANTNTRNDGGSQETCLLPASERTLCSTITEDFATRAWMMVLAITNLTTSDHQS